MNNEYVSPEFKIIVFESEDIITDSNEVPEFDPNKDEKG